MGKTRKTITIDDELARLVDNHPEFNLSGFVNQCLEQHFAGEGPGSPEMAALRAELEQIEVEIQEAKQRQERLRDKRAAIEEQLTETEDDTPELWDQAVTALSTTPRDPDNPAIQTWAGKLGMTADQLCEQLPAPEERGIEGYAGGGD